MGHAGDSGIVLGEQDESNKDVWNYRALTKYVPFLLNKQSVNVMRLYDLTNNRNLRYISLITRDHKPEDETELARIEAAGGKVLRSIQLL